MVNVYNMMKGKCTGTGYKGIAEEHTSMCPCVEGDERESGA